MRALLIFAAVGVAACQSDIPIATTQPAPGKVTVLDTSVPGGETGWWPSLAIDHTGQPHLSYCDAHYGDLRYATRIGGQWKTEIAIGKGRVGKYTALAVDSKGKVAIAFYDQDLKYLRYAEKTAEGWQSEAIAWGLEVGMAAEMRFDTNDEAHVFYYVPSGKLIHGHRKAGEWKKQVVAEATGGFSMRISPVLRPDGFWVSYVDWTFKDTTLHLARPDGDGFKSELVNAEYAPGWRSQLMFNGQQPVVYFSQNMRGQLTIAQKKGDAWSGRVLLRDLGNFAAAQSKSGEVVVAYEDVLRGSAGMGTVKLLRRKGDTWHRTIADEEGPAGSYLSLALDDQGRAIVAYFSRAIRGIKVYDETL